MFKKLLLMVFFFCVCFASVKAQLYQSPYSIYNWGDSISDLHTVNQGMGGIGIAATKSIYIPYFNPALLPNSSMVRIDASIHIERRDTNKNNLVTTDTKLSTGDFNITVPILLSRWSMGVGMQPLSNVKYENQENYLNQKVDNYTLDVSNKNIWEGGLTSLYISNGFKVYKGLNLGIKLSYIFGDIKKTKRYRTISNSFVFYDTALVIDTNANDIVYELGASYTYKVRDENNLSLGVTYQFQKDVNSEVISKSQFFVSNRATPLLNSDDATESHSIYLPSIFSTGVSYDINKSWFVGFDFKTLDWKSSRQNTDLKLENRVANSYLVGFEYIPNFDDINSYFKRIVYRGGFSYKQSPWLIDKNSIDELNYSFGLSFPLQNYSILNLGFTIGTRGVNSEVLASETFYRLSVSINYNDRWFLKRVIN